jgi:hypothetical protein
MAMKIVHFSSQEEFRKWLVKKPCCRERAFRWLPQKILGEKGR